MDTIECVEAAEAKKDEKDQEDEKKENNNNAFSLELATTIRATDPWILFLYALKAPATKDKYIERLTKFIDYLGYVGTKEEKARAFTARARADPNYAFNSVLKFFQAKREQIDRKELAIGTVRELPEEYQAFL